MTAPVWTSIPDVAERHFDELAFLWEQRYLALRAPEYSYPKFVDLERRIVSHMSGLRVAGPSVEPLAREALDSEDPFEVFAGAWAVANPAIGNDLDGLVSRFAASEGAGREGLAMLLSLWPVTAERIERLRQDADPGLAAACAEVLAFHRALPRTPAEIEPLVLSDDPALQIAGWRIASLAIIPLPEERFASALREDEPAVQLAALTAGAWCGVQGVHRVLRWAAETSPGDYAYLLPLFGVVSGDGDVDLLDSIAANSSLGPIRFEVLAGTGRVRYVDALLRGMESTEPLTAFAAGRAFSRMTGLNIDSSVLHRIPLASEDSAEPTGLQGDFDAAPGDDARAPGDDESPDDGMEAEFYEELTLPDAAAARSEWARLENDLGGARRIAQGQVIDRVGRDVLSSVDMLTRYQMAMLLRFHGLWQGSLVDVEEFG